VALAAAEPDVVLEPLAAAWYVALAAAEPDVALEPLAVARYVALAAAEPDVTLAPDAVAAWSVPAAAVVASAVFDHGPCPSPLIAKTRNSYAVSKSRPVTVAPVEDDTPSGNVIHVVGASAAADPDVVLAPDAVAAWVVGPDGWTANVAE